MKSALGPSSSSGGLVPAQGSSKKETKSVTTSVTTAGKRNESSLFLMDSLAGNLNSAEYGSGFFIFNSNNATYEGDYHKTSDGVRRHGKGHYAERERDGDAYYEGAWKEDLMHGQGKFHFANGAEYEGQWVAGMFEGNGKFTFPDQSFYEGQFQQNKFHGNGAFTTASGKRYEGFYYNNCGPGLSMAQEKEVEKIEEKQSIPEKEVNDEIEINPRDALAMITFFCHSGFKIKGKGIVIYIDPFKLPPGTNEKADIVLVTHSHFDHFSPEDIEQISKPGTNVVLPRSDFEDKIRYGMKLMSPGDKMSLKNVLIEAVPAYNITKQFHPKESKWLGYVITVDGFRFYHSGDTDPIPEMGELKEIDVAMIPVGGTYTMSPVEAVEAAHLIKASYVIPMHYGDIVGGAGTDEYATMFSQAFSNSQTSTSSIVRILPRSTRITAPLPPLPGSNNNAASPINQPSTPINNNNATTPLITTNPNVSGNVK